METRQTRSYSDVYLTLGVLVIMALMVLRLPVAIIDALVAVNIAMGMGLLLIAIYIPTPVAFSSFPSVLLISTLFRLALSVATTRLILLNGDAGHIIDAFGQFVAGGNLVVGVVVFLIITVVQFIVVAKGAERVAEVSARFTLDAMPGKQMSIDSDLRSGLIDQEEAKRRRENLAKESELNGSLDGAMKFVKGDAIASIIIVVVNLVGGLTIGVMQRDMGFADAMAVYSILTIGDGMVAQIPALLGAMAAGLVVTRSAGSEGSGHLGSVIGKQLITQPRALIATGLISLLMSLVPGFPTLIFLGLASLLLISAYLSNPTQLKGFFLRTKDGDELADTATQQTAHDSRRETAQPLVLEINPNSPQLDIDHLLNQFSQVRQRLSNQLGVPLPTCEVLPLNAVSSEHFRFLVYDVDVTPPFKETVDSVSLTESLDSVLRDNASRFLGIQEVSDLIEFTSRQYGALVKELLRIVSIQHVAQVLRCLVNEDIPIRNLRDIFEALVEWGGREKDPESLAEFVRIGLKHSITARHCDRSGTINAIVVQPDIEDTVRGSISQTQAGQILSMSPATAKTILANLTTLTQSNGTPDVVITAADVRRHIFKLVHAQFPNIHVLSYQELMMPVTINQSGKLSLQKRAA